MIKIDKLLLIAKRKLPKDEYSELKKAIARMTTDQLKELAYSDPPPERVREIFESIRALHILESEGDI